jgi:hypothetical protein
MTTLDHGGFDAVLGLLALAVLLGNRMLARRNRRRLR